MRVFTLALLLALGCATTTSEPDFIVTFDMLSDAEQARVRPMLAAASGDPDFGNADKQWVAIVKAACKKDSFANCVCCQQKTARDCNRSNWDCCSSAVFAPKDGSSCMGPPDCGCTPPQ